MQISFCRPDKYSTIAAPETSASHEFSDSVVGRSHRTTTSILMNSHYGLTYHLTLEKSRAEAFQTTVEPHLARELHLHGPEGIHLPF